MKTEMIYVNAPRWLRAAFTGLALALAAFILIKSIGAISVRVNISNGDKLLHAAAYFALGLPAYPALAKMKPLHVWVLLVGFGLLIELLQGTMGAGRTADWLDGVANAAGAMIALFAWLVFSILARRVSRQNSPKTRNR